MRYGGNTACVEVRGQDGALLVLDAGTGIRRLGRAVPGNLRVDILLSHLHTDHIQGLGFFAPLFQPGREIHIWGPPSTTKTLRQRLVRYLSAPLFPVHLSELPSRPILHDAPLGGFEIGGFEVRAELVLHPGPTLGYRLTEGGATTVYMPDHEPALGASTYPPPPEWTSGYALAEGADLLIHDAQYRDDEYEVRVGWGHSSINQATTFGRHAGAHKIVTFHHDPDHSDQDLDRLHEAAVAANPGLDLVRGVENLSIEVG